VTKRLSVDLRREFADMKGLSKTNLRHMRAFAQAWPDWEICSQAPRRRSGGRSACPVDGRAPRRETDLV